MTCIERIAGLLEDVPAMHHLRIYRQHAGRVTARWSTARRPSPEHRIYYTRRGRGVQYVGEDRTWPMESGRMTFIGAGTVWNCLPDPDAPPDFVVVHVGLHSNEDGRRLADPEPFAFTLKAPDRTRYRSLFEAVHDECVTERYTDTRLALTRPLLHALLGTLLRDLRRRAAGERLDPRIEQVRRYMEDNPTDRSPVDELAGRAGLSPAYFSRMFAEQVGTPPKSYQVQVRLRYARMLLEGGMQVQQCAYALDYPDPFQFSRQFKQVWGYPPSQVRDRGEPDIG
jgi:AraC-like DNA-binding protein/mannose-6-phosphate isomerase-like protein (cupin superfamily)